LADHPVGRLRAERELQADAPVRCRCLAGEVERTQSRRPRVGGVVAAEEADVGGPGGAARVIGRGLEDDQHGLALAREHAGVVALHPPEVGQVEDVVGRADDERVEPVLVHQRTHALELRVVPRPGHPRNLPRGGQGQTRRSVPALHVAYPSRDGADGSFCQRPNSFPCGAVQVGNQPICGTGIGSPACPPSSFTRAAPALMSSTRKYARVPFLPGSMFVTAAPCWSPICVMWYSDGPGYDWNCHPKSEPQNSWDVPVSSAGISMWTICPAMRPPSRSRCDMGRTGLRPVPHRYHGPHGRNRAGAAYQRTRGRAGSPWPSCHEITGFRSTPIFSISASITSPGLRYHANGSSLKPATPDTVPSERTSPALNPSGEQC